jgi:hypothetical protein
MIAVASHPPKDLTPPIPYLFIASSKAFNTSKMPPVFCTHSCLLITYQIAGIASVYMNNFQEKEGEREEREGGQGYTIAVLHLCII